MTYHLGIDGAVPEWLGIGLQNRVHRFDSGRHLHSKKFMTTRTATAYANANIALVKYWGKHDGPLNIPAVSSISMTLDGFGCLVTISSSTSSNHELIIEDKIGDLRASTRLHAYLEQVRMLFPFNGFLRVVSSSNVPYASGLASSAAFFAAIAVAINDFFSLKLSEKNLSLLARLGSGSAARSIFRGFVGLYGGAINHDEAFAFPVESNASLDLCMIAAVVSTKEKSISSRDAMHVCTKTSAFFKEFIATSKKDFHDGIIAFSRGDFLSLGTIMEHSTLKMFAVMWSAMPAINYWQPATVLLINAIYELRKMHGPIAFFTMDAGPNVKILCERSSIDTVKEALLSTCGALTLHTFFPGAGAHRREAKDLHNA